MSAQPPFSTWQHPTASSSTMRGVGVQLNPCGAPHTCTDRQMSSSCTLSNFSVSCRTAASPSCRTWSQMGPTCTQAHSLVCVSCCGVCLGPHQASIMFVTQQLVVFTPPLCSSSSSSCGLTVLNMDVKSILGRCISFLSSSSVRFSEETVFSVRSMLATAETCSRPLLLRFGSMASPRRTRDLLDELTVRYGPTQLQRVLWRIDCIATATGEGVYLPLNKPRWHRYT